MQSVHEEAELESLFLRLAPNLQREWRGASTTEINAIEKIAGRPLPIFYRWFLERMGKQMGSLSYDLIDFSVEKILKVYKDENITPDGCNLLIGYNNDKAMPMHIFYNLDLPAREDCMVGQMELDDNCVRPKFETFREMLGWGKFTTRRVKKFPQVFSGVVSVSQGLARPHVDAIMKDLGFVEVLTCGPFCGLYDRDNAAISYTGTPSLAPRMLVFRLGGADVDNLRDILGKLATTEIEVKVTDGQPSSN